MAVWYSRPLPLTSDVGNSFWTPALKSIVVNHFDSTKETFKSAYLKVLSKKLVKIKRHLLTCRQVEEGNKGTDSGARLPRVDLMLCLLLAV